LVYCILKFLDFHILVGNAGTLFSRISFKILLMFEQLGDELCQTGIIRIELFQFFIHHICLILHLRYFAFSWSNIFLQFFDFMVQNVFEFFQFLGFLLQIIYFPFVFANSLISLLYHEQLLGNLLTKNGISMF
jgi:hypothetical protein